jgi:nitrite reductase/ring-hydroxylating ferredoxin subunit
MTDYLLCKFDELEEAQPKAFEIPLEADNTLNLIAYTYEGQIKAYLNYCPHLGIQLNWQPDDFLSLEGTHIQCATHGALFELHNGDCVAGPCRGDNLTQLNVQRRDDEVILIRA